MRVMTMAGESRIQARGSANLATDTTTAAGTRTPLRQKWSNHLREVWQRLEGAVSRRSLQNMMRSRPGAGAAARGGGVLRLLWSRWSTPAVGQRLERNTELRKGEKEHGLPHVLSRFRALCAKLGSTQGWPGAG